MSRFLRIATLSMLVSGFTLTLAPSVAQARGIAIINTGEDIFETGDVPETLMSEGSPAGWKAGYKCSIFGVFWAYFAVWDCKPVAFSGDSYDDSQTVVAALEAAYTEDDIQMGVWTKHGRWLFLLIIGLGIVAAIKGAGDDEEEEAA